MAARASWSAAAVTVQVLSTTSPAFAGSSARSRPRSRKLAFDGRTVRLGGPAAEIFHVESCHVSILTQLAPGSTARQRKLRRSHNLRASRGNWPTAGAGQTRFALESGRREEGELAADSGNRLQVSSSKSSRGRLPLLLETLPAEYRTPLRWLERHRGFLAALRAGGARFHLGEAVASAPKARPQY